MENLRRHFTTKEKNDTVVGRVKRNCHCKKHPKHHQSPGVCSLCLREKLTQLSSSSSSRRASSIIITSTSSSSLSSYYSSSSASSCASPMHCFPFTTEGKSNSLVSVFLLGGDHGIVKSRSLAIFPRRKDCEGNNKSANKSGFWFKLLHPKNKRIEDDHKKLIRSMSLKYKRKTINSPGA